MKLRRRRRVQDARLSARARVPRASGVGGATTGTTELVLRLCTLSASVASGFGSDDYDFWTRGVGVSRPQKKYDSYCSDLHSSTGDRGPTPRHVSHKKETTGRALSNAAMRSVVEDDATIQHERAVKF